MRFNYLFHALAQSILEGDIQRVSNYLRRKLINIRQKIMWSIYLFVGVEYKIIENVDAPDWINAQNDVVTVRLFERDTIETSFKTVFAGDATSGPVSITPPQEFGVLEFVVLRGQNVESVAITVFGETKDGREISKEVSFDIKDEAGLREIPVSIQFDTAICRAEIKLEEVKESSYSFDRLLKGYKPPTETWMSVPTPRTDAKPSVPIFLISIDSLRYDKRDIIESTIGDFLEAFTIPKEPRTQGHWTTPSHASMLTGVHPGIHSHVGKKGDAVHARLGRPWNPIKSDLPQIGQILSNKQYKCSGIVSQPALSPTVGVCRQFDRFRTERMTVPEFVDRTTDSACKINQVIRWVDRDLQESHNRLFYFIHTFDPHLPYYPERPYSHSIDFGFPDRYLDEMWRDDYIAAVGRENPLSQAKMAEMKQNYRESIEFTALQLRRLFRVLEDRGLFDDALIIVTGDHGEEFGERGFPTHKTLYDANIRPFMMIKPPAGTNWEIPETVDTIDILPTIAKLTGEESSTACQGTPLQIKSEDDVRITERIFPDYYNIAVEKDGTKAIYTYESAHPSRPSQQQVKQGPILTEYYDLSDVRAQKFEDIKDQISSKTQRELRQKAESFITDTRADIQEHSSFDEYQNESLKKQLEDLGYR